jgi:Lipocalin-like domain
MLHVRRGSYAAIALISATVSVCFEAPASAQTTQELVGVWTLVKNETIRPDGSRVATFGDNPHSQLIMTSTGRFSQIFIRSDIPKFASGNRLTGTQEENAAVVKGSNVAFGTWVLADKTVTLNVEGSTFPNWAGTALSRPIVKFANEEMTWTVAGASGGGSIESAWKRVK